MSEIRIFCPCPPPCKEPPGYWVHNLCGGDSYLRSTGDLYCKKCGRLDFIQNWSFSCSGSTHGQDCWLSYRTPGDFVYALSVGLKSMESSGIDTIAYAKFMAILSPNITSRWAF